LERKDKATLCIATSCKNISSFLIYIYLTKNNREPVGQNGGASNAPFGTQPKKLRSHLEFCGRLE